MFADFVVVFLYVFMVYLLVLEFGFSLLLVFFDCVVCCFEFVIYAIS